MEINKGAFNIDNTTVKSKIKNSSIQCVVYFINPYPAFASLKNQLIPEWKSIDQKWLLEHNAGFPRNGIVSDKARFTLDGVVKNKIVVSEKKKN